MIDWLTDLFGTPEVYGPPLPPVPDDTAQIPRNSLLVGTVALVAAWWLFARVLR